MPVDLSRIGLEGIETAQRTLNSIANRDALASQTAIAQAEESRTAEDRAIDQWAVGALDSIGKGNGTPPMPGEDGLSFGNSDDDPSAKLRAIGERYLAAGAPKRGKEFIEAAIDYQKKQTEINAAGDNQDKVRLDNMVTAGGWVAQNIGENENEYQHFLSQLDDPNNPVAGILGADNVAALKQTPWSPELVNYLKSKALSVKDQASLALTERGQNRADQSARDTAAYRESLLKINQANLDERRRENERKNKTDGPNVSKAPTGDERKTAQRAIVNNVKALAGTLPPEDTPEYEAVLNMTDDIVGRAKIIVSESKGLTFPEAVEQAVAESEAAGDFGIIKAGKETGWLDFERDKPAEIGYKRRGKSPDSPIPLPKDKSKWVKGRYYQQNGKVGRYGTDFN